jgi:hypothetical protein
VVPVQSNQQLPWMMQNKIIFLQELTTKLIVNVYLNNFLWQVQELLSKFLFSFAQYAGNILLSVVQSCSNPYHSKECKTSPPPP